MIRSWRAAAVAALVVVSPVAAQDAISDHLAMLGFGYHSSEAPIGLRFWTGPGLGFEAGVGFRTENEVPMVGPGGMTRTTSLASVAVEGALLLPLRSDENMIIYFRPGLLYTADQMVVDVGPDIEQDKDTETSVSLGASMGVELFFGRMGFENLSLSAGIGLQFTSTSPAGGGDSKAVIETTIDRLSFVESTDLGFHFYF